MLPFSVVRSHLGNLGLVPLGRIGLPIDMGKVVAFLASDESAFVTGEVIYADGWLPHPIAAAQP